MKTGTNFLALVAVAATAAAVPLQEASGLVVRQVDNYIAVVQAADTANGFNPKTRSEFLEGDAQSRGDSQGGVQGDSVPPPIDGAGRSAQLQCPGRFNSGPDTGPFTAFELAYYTWLCQRPDLPAVAGRCADVFRYSSVVPGDGTGFADIILDPRYTEVGCAYSDDPNTFSDSSPFQGVWICNFRG